MAYIRKRGKRWHAAELAGAAKMVAKWADELEKESAAIAEMSQS